MPKNREKAPRLRSTFIFTARYTLIDRRNNLFNFRSAVLLYLKSGPSHKISSALSQTKSYQLQPISKTVQQLLPSAISQARRKSRKLESNVIPAPVNNLPIPQNFIILPAEASKDKQGDNAGASRRKIRSKAAQYGIKLYIYTETERAFSRIARARAGKQIE